MSARPYRTRPRRTSSSDTRARINAAVRELMAEGRFHESTVEQVAERAGVSRATLYQHFRSRLELVDAMCETFDANPALRELRRIVELPDSDDALRRTIAGSMAFWSSEDAVLRPLYGVSAVDPAARDLVDRQRRDRRSEMERLVRNLRRTKRLRPGVTAPRALALLMVLTSYETYGELREAGLSDARITALLQASAAELLAAGAPRPPAS